MGAAAWLDSMAGRIERASVLDPIGEALGTLAQKVLHPLLERAGEARQLLVSPDGALWLLTDNPEGRVLRVVPQ